MKKLLIVIGFTLVLTACNTDESIRNLNDAFPMVDRVGFDISIPDEIESIVSMAPSITLILIDLGLEDRIVAMDTNSAFMIDGSIDVPMFDMLNPEIESIITLNPDIIFASTMSMMGNEANDPFTQLRDLGITVAYIPTSESIEGIQADIGFIATVTGKIQEGEALITEMKNEINEIMALIDHGEAIPRVYFEISPAPDMFSFGYGVFLHEMIELIGAENIFGELSSWISVEAESVVSANPDVIFTNVNFIDDPTAEILSRPGFEGVNAVLNERVYYIENQDTTLPTHHIIRGMRAMAEHLLGIYE